jgi:hypothetical protein
MADVNKYIWKALKTARGRWEGFIQPVKYVQEGESQLKLFFFPFNARIQRSLLMLTTSVTKSPKNVGAGYNPPE